jgi:SsrA-binding protein
MQKPPKSGRSPGPAASQPTIPICQNRRAKHDYAFDEHLEAGVVLVGTEVKACRAGQAHLNDAYVRVVGNEAVLIGGHIAEYTQGNRFNHPVERSRKLLLHRKQIDKLGVKLHEKGLSAIPLAMYFKGGRVKLDIGIGKGKSGVDRRQDIKKRDGDREMERALRGRTRGQTR